MQDEKSFPPIHNHHNKSFFLYIKNKKKRYAHDLALARMIAVVFFEGTS